MSGLGTVAPSAETLTTAHRLFDVERFGGSIDASNRAEVDQVMTAITRVIARSFLDRPPRARSSDAAVKARFDLCVRIFRRLRLELRFSLPRAVDELPGYLRKELDDEHVRIYGARRSIWAVEDDPALRLPAVREF